MSLIDVLIPGVAGILLVTHPHLLTKAKGEAFEKVRAKLEKCGWVLIGVAVLYGLMMLVPA